MATRIYTGNSAYVSQQDIVTITGVSTSGVLNVIINNKTLSYVCTGSDTTSTAAAALATVLNASTVPPEFQEMTWVANAAVITATADTPGTPFTVTVSDSGGATLTHSTSVANVSPNDVDNPNNWSGNTLPVNGDTIIFQNSAVSVLWNLASLAAITPASITIWQSFTGNIGLLENNPAGYVEYRPTYWTIASPLLTIGTGNVGNGSGLIRINLSTADAAIVIVQTGSAITGTPYAVRILNVNASSTLQINGGSVGVGMLPGEVSTLASASVQVPGTLDLGPAVTCPTVTNNGTTLNVRNSATTLTLNGGTTSIGGTTYTTLTASAGAAISWIAAGTITTLTMSGGCTLDATPSPLAKVITNSTIDGASTFNDPWATITWTNPTALTSAVNSGPFIIAQGATVAVVQP